MHGPVHDRGRHVRVAEHTSPTAELDVRGVDHALPLVRVGHDLDRELSAISKARLLVIDELGYVPVDEEGSRLLFQVISDSYETRSVIHATNIGFSGWGRVLGDKNMAAALIDRTVRHGRLTGFEGGSYRSEHALMTR